MENKKVDLSKVLSVYSGINGKCCCGCAGKHTSSSLSKKPRSDVNDRTVKMIVNKINKLLENPIENEADYDDTYIAAVKGNRLYIAYTA